MRTAISRTRRSKWAIIPLFGPTSITRQETFISSWGITPNFFRMRLSRRSSRIQFSGLRTRRLLTEAMAGQREELDGSPGLMHFPGVLQARPQAIRARPALPPETVRRVAWQSRPAGQVALCAVLR